MNILQYLIMFNNVWGVFVVLLRDNCTALSYLPTSIVGLMCENNNQCMNSIVYESGGVLVLKTIYLQ